MRLAASCGISPAEVWQLTPWEVVRHAQHSREARGREMIALAWHVAALSGAAQAGKLEGLERYLPAERVRVVD